MTTTPARPRLAMKVRRQVWIETEHPRDRKGRFIETGAEVRWLGGFVGTVVRNVGGGRIEVLRSDGVNVVVHRNYLTVTARPDGTPPTDQQDANPAPLPEAEASPDAEEIPTPTVSPDVNTPAQSTNLHDLLAGWDDPNMAALVRQAAVDYQEALNNGTPDDEADERDGLLAVLAEIDTKYTVLTQNPDDAAALAEGLALLREAAQAEPPAEGSTYQPTTHRVPKALARVADEHADFTEDPGYAVDGQVVTITDPVKAGATLREAQTEQTQISEALGDGPAGSRAGAVAEFIGELLAEFENGSDEPASEPAAATEPVEPEVAAPVSEPDIERTGYVEDLNTPEARAARDQEITDANRELVGFAPGDEVYWQNPDPDSIITTLHGTFSHALGESGAGYIDYERHLTASDRRRRISPTQRQRVNLADLHAANPDNPSAAEVEWRTRNEPGYAAPVAPFTPEEIAETQAVVSDIMDEARATEGDRQRGFNAGQDAAHDGTFDAHEDETEAFRQGYAEGHASVTDDDVTVTADDLAETLRDLDVAADPEALPHSDEALTSARVKAKYAGIDYGHGSPQHMAAKAEYERMVTENRDVEWGRRDAGADHRANLPERDLFTQSDAYATAYRAERRRRTRIAAGIDTDTKPVYAGENEGGNDERTGGTSGEALPGVPTEGVRRDPGEGSSSVLREEGGDGDGADPRLGGEPAGTGPRGRDDGGEDRPVLLGEDDGSVTDRAGSDTGDAGTDGAGGAAAGRGDDEEPRGVREAAGDAAAVITADDLAEVLDALDDSDSTRPLPTLEELAASVGDMPVPVLPDKFEDLESGTRIRIGFEDFAKDVTFLRMRSSWGETRVDYVDDDGIAAVYRPHAGEKPRPALPNPVQTALVREIVESAIMETTEEGLPRQMLGPAVGTWRTRLDPVTDGVVHIEGDGGVKGVMRPTIDGWRGRIGEADPDRDTGEDRNPMLVDRDPQALLDRLYDYVNGEGAGDRTRLEVAQGRPPAPEVSRTYKGLRSGARIKVLDPESGEIRNAMFRSYYQNTWSSHDFATLYVTFDGDDPLQESTELRVPLTARPVPGDPLAVDEAGMPVEEDDGQPTYEPDPSAVERVVPGDVTFKPTGIEDFAQNGTMRKLDDNLAVLRLLRKLDREQRPARSADGEEALTPDGEFVAGPNEQAILAKWAGWGGLAEVFDVTKKGPWVARRDELFGLLSKSEIVEARRNTMNAHYTDANVVKAMWAAARDLGVKGRIIEPGSGSGTFIGFAPDDVDMVGVELDSTTAAISKHLYPKSHIRNEGFEKTNIPPGAVDGSIGNVPFGNFKLHDPIYNQSNESIHNHFILKTMEFTRPGGIITLLSSRYTLDSQSERARRKMLETCDLIGAVRLPNGSHQRVSGTDVIEDILIFRKRLPGEEPQSDQSWITASKRVLGEGGGYNVSVNHYFDQHPDHVLGELTARNGAHGGEVAVVGDKTVPTLPRILAGITAAARRDGLTATERPDDDPLPTLIAPNSGRQDGNIKYEADGTFTQALQGASVPLKVSPKKADEVRRLAELRDTFLALLDAERGSVDENDAMRTLRANLNTQYDEYYALYGPLRRFTWSKSGSRVRPRHGFDKDPMHAVVQGLEKFSPPRKGDTGHGSAVKTPIFTKRAVGPRVPVTHTDDPADALALSMDRTGKVDLELIRDLLGAADLDDARAQLGTLVFEVPPLTKDEEDDAEAAGIAILNSDGSIANLADLSIGQESLREAGTLVTASEYLSGQNVRRKLAAARVAAEADPRYYANVEALTGVIPRDLEQTEIAVRLGASWIPASVVEQFANETLGIGLWENKKVRVVASGTGTWIVDAPSSPKPWKNYKTNDVATVEWGTKERPFHSILQRCLEQKAQKINKDDYTSQENRQASEAAEAKAKMIQERFAEWVWEDPERARKLQFEYNYRFNSTVLRGYDGSKRSFAGMRDKWKAILHPHIRNAVERIVNEPTVLLAHVPGAGKTNEMVIGSQELKRLGLCRKPAIVVPDHVLDQFAREYLDVYPDAKILTAGKGMNAADRRQFVSQAATGDWDAIIMTQSAFGAIPMSADGADAYIQREVASLRDQLDQAKAAVPDNAPKNDPRRRSVKKMETMIQAFETRLRKNIASKRDTGISFEQTGIDYLMVDEAHHYSNLMTSSSVEGAGASGSVKAADLHMKIEHLRENSLSGRVATFATGTPIRNTVTQAYVMVRYLRPDLLRAVGIHSFDQWAATFGKVVPETEISPEGGDKWRVKQRFARFRNVPEFLRMFHTFADVKMFEDLPWLETPNLMGGKPIAIPVPATESQLRFVESLGPRADAIRNGQVDPSEDNMLKLSGEGRKASLSMSLVIDPGTGEKGVHEPGKLEIAADKIHEIYERQKDVVYANGPNPGALQIVFMDLGTPKGAKLTKAERLEAGLDEVDMDDDTTAEGAADFNGYDRLRDQLIENGVPADKIRYVHEAKTDAEVDELFESCKDGRTAVLIGSTEKMGTGTNIQQRAKALHHIDAPWRPSDVEQRERRVLRQGNLHKDMGEDVEIYRYVTEQSFDTYMWQTLERKAKFINQIMRGTLDVREIEDVGDEALGYAVVKAVSLKNPDYMHLTVAEAEYGQLSRLARAYETMQTNTSTDLVLNKEKVENTERTAAELSRAVESTVIPESFRMSVGDEVFETPTDEPDADDDLTSRAKVEALTGTPRQRAGEALRLRMLELRAAQRGYGSADDKVMIGTYAGHQIMAHTRQDTSNNRVVVLTLGDAPSVEFASFRLDQLKPTGAMGIVSRIRNMVNGLPERQNNLIARAADARAEINRMEARVGKPFDREHDLQAWKHRLERVTAKMARDELRKSGQDIPFDPRIDSEEFDDPITLGAATTFIAPPEEAPARAEVNAQDLLEGQRIEFVIGDMSGVTGEGVIEKIRVINDMIFVTIKGDDGKTYVRQFVSGEPVARLADPSSLTGVKGYLPRQLEIKGGRVVVVDFKRAPRFDEGEHPRDRKGRFIEKNASVTLWGGGKGTVVEVVKGGRVRVKRDDGQTVVVDSGNVTVVATPKGEEITAETPNDVPDEAAVDATDADAGEPVTEPAPDATPDGAEYTFTGANGERAWLDLNDDGEPVGYIQTDANDPMSIVRYADANEWADAVDTAEMAEENPVDVPNSGSTAYDMSGPTDADRAADRAAPAAAQPMLSEEDAEMSGQPLGAPAEGDVPFSLTVTAVEDDGSLVVTDFDGVEYNVVYDEADGIWAAEYADKAPEIGTGGMLAIDANTVATADDRNAALQALHDRVAFASPIDALRARRGRKKGETSGIDSEAVAAAAAAFGNKGKPDATGTQDDPIDVAGDLELAVRLIGEGKHIRLNTIAEVGTLLDKVVEMVADATAKGEEAPEYNLCLASVPDTNLFCAESQGIPRAKMPQLSGKPVPGTRAAELPVDKKGKVDITPEFLAELDARGVSVTDKSVPAAWLKATQNQLDGPKVAGIAGVMAAGNLPDATIFVTRDGYVIDGHHRWAAKIAVDTENGVMGDEMMPVQMLDMEIGEALDFTNAFTTDFGIAPAEIGANANAGYAPATVRGAAPAAPQAPAAPEAPVVPDAAPVAPATAPDAAAAPEAGTGDVSDAVSTPEEQAEFATRASAAETPNIDAAAASLGNKGTAEATGTVEDPIDVQGDLELAARLLGEGKHIRLNKVEEVSTLLDQLVALVADAQSKGEKAPTYDLCNVSVPGTNLFCAETLGIPRTKMPQLGGTPVPGTAADALAKDSKGKVDVTEEFLAELAARGIGVTNKDVPAAWLKASQNQLDGPKVAGIADRILNPDTHPLGPLPNATIFVTRDGYVIDGHHRWAAQVAADAKDGTLGDVTQSVQMLDMEIGEALDFTNAFTLDMGIQPQGIGAAADQPTPNAPAAPAAPANADGIPQPVPEVAPNLLAENRALAQRRNEAYLARIAAGDDPTTALSKVPGSMTAGGTPPIRPVPASSRTRWLPPTVAVSAIAVGDGIGLLLPNESEPWIPAPSNSLGQYIDPATKTFTPERQALHDSIVASFLDGVNPPEGQPSLWMLGGGAGAGKTTMRNEGTIDVPPKDSKQAVEVAADEIKAMLPDYIEMTAAGDLSAAAFVHMESQLIASRLRTEAINRGLSLVLDGIGNTSADYIRERIAQAREKGYRVVGQYATIPTVEALKRAKIREEKEKRRVPSGAVVSGHSGVSGVLPQVLGDFDEVTLYDTSVWGSPRPLLRATAGEQQVIDAEGWGGFIAKAADVKVNEVAEGMEWQNVTVPEGGVERPATTRMDVLRAAGLGGASVEEQRRFLQIVAYYDSAPEALRREIETWLAANSVPA